MYSIVKSVKYISLALDFAACGFTYSRRHEKCKVDKVY